MAAIFVSYSRADAQFISEFVHFLHASFGPASTFYDEQIPGGKKWWDAILEEIAASTLFIYLCSNDSLRSSYCQSELREAVRLQKQILPVIVRPQTVYPYAEVNYGNSIPDDIANILRDTNNIDLSKGLRDRDSGPKASAKLFRAINEAFNKAPAGPRQPLTAYPIAQPKVNGKGKRWWIGGEPQAILVTALITAVFMLIAAAVPMIIGGQNMSQNQQSLGLTLSVMPTQTLSPSPSPIHLTPILTTTPLTGSFVIELMDKNLIALLGPPIGGGVKVESEGAYQEFEHGLMLFRSSFPPEESIFVLYPEGLYEAFPNLWHWGVDDPIREDVGSPEGLFQPVNGFGLSWLDNQQVRQQLGWATGCELSTDLLIQTFTKGIILRLDMPRRFTYIESMCGNRNQYVGKTLVLLYSPRDSTSGTWIKLHD